MLRNLLVCQRRKAEDLPEQQPSKSADSLQKFAFLPEGKQESTPYVDDSCKNTEPPSSDTDLPRDISSIDSSDISDSELGSSASPNSASLCPSEPKFVPQCMGPPPGLELPFHAFNGDTNPASDVKAWGSLWNAGSRLNSQAQPFVPMASAAAVATPMDGSHQLRQSIRLLRGALEEMEASIPEPAVPMQDQSMFALQGTLSQLTPQTASAMTGPGFNHYTSTPYRPSLCEALSLPEFPAVPPGNMGGVPLPVKAVKNTTLEAPKAAAEGPIDGTDDKDTLRTNLRDLANQDPGLVVIVRKINRLGLNSPEMLHKYFSQFGEVERVMVSHSKAKSIYGKASVRVRPAGLGFLVMRTPEAVQAALRMGSEHVVEGTTINVLPFEERGLNEDKP